MITALISILTTGLFLLFVLVLLAAVAFSLYRKVVKGEKNPGTGQRLLMASFLALVAGRLQR